MRWIQILWMCGLASCGDNQLPIGTPLVHARDVAIVAHPEDDLLFMQPDLLERTLGGGVMNVYIADGTARSAEEHLGLMNAYAAATGVRGWHCGWVEVGEVPVEHCRLEDAHLSLVFLGYPPSDALGTDVTSLSQLWAGRILRVSTTTDRPATFTRDALVDVLRRLLEITEPRTVRALDIASTHGPDHADHVISGVLTLLAIARSTEHPEVISYRGESTELEPPNVMAPLFVRSAEVIGFYAACSDDCAACGDRCLDIGNRRAVWLQRRYAIAQRRHAAGALRTPDGACAVPHGDGSLELSACLPTGPRWELGPDGFLRVDGACLGFEPMTRALRIGTETCARFFYDDEGHMIAGAAPPAAPGGPLLCLVVAGDRVRSGRCGAATGAPIWDLAPVPTAVPRPSGLTRTGRAIRLGDVDGDRRADLCAIEGGMLRCARGTGSGGFAATAVDLHPLPVEPESLVLGDVDGDGLVDACGRDAGGITCATALTGYVAERWSHAFARTGPGDAADRSLAAVDADANGAAEICGISERGVVCAEHDLTGLPEVRSTWPVRASVLWPGDLDGDRRADWCGVVDGRVGCGLAYYRSLTSVGTPWAFSQGGIPDAAPVDAAVSGMADLDGDGRTDLCSVRGARVVCARSQGFGFGPEFTAAVLPVGAAITGLWLGDLDGDGRADVCADDGSVRCVHSP